MDKSKSTSTGITNCTPDEFASGGFLLFGGMLILMGLMPLGFAIFIIGSVINNWFDSTQKVVSVEFSGADVSTAFAIGIFVCIALVLFSIGSVMLWFGRLVTSTTKTSPRPDSVNRKRKNVE